MHVQLQDLHKRCKGSNSEASGEIQGEACAKRKLVKTFRGRKHHIDVITNSQWYMPLLERRLKEVLEKCYKCILPAKSQQSQSGK